MSKEFLNYFLYLEIVYFPNIEFGGYPNSVISIGTLICISILFTYELNRIKKEINRPVMFDFLCTHTCFILLHFISLNGLFRFIRPQTVPVSPVFCVFPLPIILKSHQVLFTFFKDRRKNLTYFVVFVKYFSRRFHCLIFLLHLSLRSSFFNSFN